MKNFSVQKLREAFSHESPRSSETLASGIMNLDSQKQVKWDKNTMPLLKRPLSMSKCVRTDAEPCDSGSFLTCILDGEPTEK